MFALEICFHLSFSAVCVLALSFPRGHVVKIFEWARVTNRASQNLPQTHKTSWYYHWCKSRGTNVNPMEDTVLIGELFPAYQMLKIRVVSL